MVYRALGFRVSWIIKIVWLYIALTRTPNMDCYGGGASTQVLGFRVIPTIFLNPKEATFAGWRLALRHQILDPKTLHPKIGFRVQGSGFRV